jgi:hypothetical protein
MFIYLFFQFGFAVANQDHLAEEYHHPTYVFDLALRL